MICYFGEGEEQVQESARAGSDSFLGILSSALGQPQSPSPQITVFSSKLRAQIAKMKEGLQRIASADTSRHSVQISFLPG